MSDIQWVRKEGDDVTHDHHFTTLTDGIGWWEARVVNGGCFDLTRYHNDPFGGGDDDNVDRIHICDLDDLIERLQALKVAAKSHFGEAWPDL